MFCSHQPNCKLSQLHFHIHSNKTGHVREFYINLAIYFTPLQNLKSFVNYDTNKNVHFIQRMGVVKIV